MTLIQLLLPARGRTDFTDNDLAQTRQELVERFGGVTAYPQAPAEGAWRNPAGKVEDDEMVMVEVLAGNFEQPWWTKYVDMLRQRFQQQEIHLRAIAVETLAMTAP